MAGEEQWYSVDLVLGSDSVLEGRYGHIRIEKRGLDSAAEELNRRPDTPMVAQHDPNHVIRIRNRHAWVEQNDQGTWLLRLRAEVHADDWGHWQEIREAAEATGGMSMAFTQPLVVADQPPGILVVGDAADFDEELLAQLARDAPDVPVAVSELYQFAAEPEAVRLIIEFVGSVLMAVPVELIAGWIANVIERLRVRASELGRPPAFDVRYRRDPDGSVDLEARFWVSDSEIAEEALESVMETLKSLRNDDG